MKKHLLYEKKSNYTKNLTLLRTCYFCKYWLCNAVDFGSLPGTFPEMLPQNKFLASICNSIGDALNDKRRCSFNWRLIPWQILPWGNFQRILRDFLNKKDTRVVFGDKNCQAIRPDCRIREKLCNRTIHSTRAILDAEARLGECNGSVIMCTCSA